MALTVFLIWSGSIAIGTAGAAAALSNQWARALGYNVAAGIYWIAIMRALRGTFAITLFQAGDIYVWLTMVGPLVMWIILGIGASIAIWKQRRRLAASQ